MRVCGVDEAGRGPLIGPLVVGAVLVEEGGEGELARLGVRDSKGLHPRRREELAERIRACAIGWRVRAVEAAQIDREGITAPELACIARVVEELQPHRLVVDQLGGMSAARFRRELSLRLPGWRGEVVYGPRLDERHPVVAAASILAKVERDRRLREVHRLVGQDFGSGYPNARTMRFLREYLRLHGALPPQARSRWAPVRRLLQELEKKNRSGTTCGDP